MATLRRSDCDVYILSSISWVIDDFHSNLPGQRRKTEEEEATGASHFGVQGCLLACTSLTNHYNLLVARQRERAGVGGVITWPLVNVKSWQDSGRGRRAGKILDWWDFNLMATCFLVLRCSEVAGGMV